MLRKPISMPNESVKKVSLEKNTSVSCEVKKDKIVKKKNKKCYIDKIDNNSIGSMRDGFSKGLVEIGRKSKKVVVLCADLKGSVKAGDFAKKYPNRYFEFGVSEQNMMGGAVGMCLNDKIPFVTSYAAFNPGRNWDQLRVSVCYSNSNVKILGSHAGLLTGPDGATHQALEDIAITRVLPNLVVIAPCDEEEMRKAVIGSYKHEGPIYLRMPREKSLNITDKNSKFEIGKANVLDNGNDLLIVSYGTTVSFALFAKKKLLKEGIDATVMNMHTIKPIDESSLVKYVKKCGAVLTVEDHQVIGGLGSAVCEVLSEKFPVLVDRIGVYDKFGESGDGYELLDKYKISCDEIVKRGEKLVERKGK
jgi:transketolase